LAPATRTFSVTPLDARGGAEHIDGSLRALSGAESVPHSLPGRGSGPVSQGHSPPTSTSFPERAPHMSDTSGTPRTPRRPRRVRRALVAVVSTLGLAAAAATAATPSASASAPPPPSGWNQVFLDDFDGPAGSGVNTSNWRYSTG